MYSKSLCRKNFPDKHSNCLSQHRLNNLNCCWYIFDRSHWSVSNWQSAVELDPLRRSVHGGLFHSHGHPDDIVLFMQSNNFHLHFLYFIQSSVSNAICHCPVSI